MSEQAAEKKKVIIIGGGIAGLAAGCYLQMNNYQSIVLEKNSICGGVSTSWKRNGYTFDGATNWLAGSSPAANMHFLLKELIDLNDFSFIDPEIFISIKGDGDCFNVYTDREKLRNEMMRIAPDDQHTIDRFIKAIQTAGRLNIPYDKPPELFTLGDYIQILYKNFSFISFYLRWKNITIRQFAQRFTNPHMAKFFMKIFPHHPFFSMVSLIQTLGWMSVGSGGYPIGGSAKFMETLERRLKKLGGLLYKNKEVKRILVDQGRAAGILCADGTRIEGDIVISSADAVYTFETLLEGKYRSEKQKREYNARLVYPALIQVSFGIRRTFQGPPYKLNLPLKQKISVNGCVFEDMTIRICSFDPTLAPAGCTALLVHLKTDDYTYWVELREKDRVCYDKEKESIAQCVLRNLNYHLGPIDHLVDAVDVATPATYIRYTNIFKGSYQGWAPTPSMIGKALPKTINDLKNVYLAGQWTWAAGGIPGVIRQARHIVQILCKKDGKSFTVIN